MYRLRSAVNKWADQSANGLGSAGRTLSGLRPIFLPSLADIRTIICSHISSPSGSEIVEQAVVGDAARLRVHAICIQKRGLPSVAVVPCRAPCRYGDVCPTIGHAQRAEVYMASALSVRTNDGVWSAGIAVTHDEVVLGWTALQAGQGLVDREGAMVRMPRVGVEESRTCSSVNVTTAVHERPAERALGDRGERHGVRGVRRLWLGQQLADH